MLGKHIFGKRIGFFVWVVVGLFVFLAGQQTIMASEKKQVTISLGVDLPNTDPYGHYNMAGFSIWHHMMETLIMLDSANKKYIPRLAISWSAKGKEWVFNLRKGVKFHNGNDFTAHDVKFSIETILKSRQANFLRDLDRVEVVDDHTVKFITKQPYPIFISRLYDLMIVSKKHYEKLGEAAKKNPIGTGPFKFVEWKKGSYLVAEKNEKYWGGAPKIDRVIWRPIGEDSARITALEKGTVDIAVDIPAHEAERLGKNPDIKIMAMKSMRLMQIGLNQKFEPFKKYDVRMAMNYAVDVDSLIKFVMGGKGYKATSLSGPNSLGHDPNLTHLPYDPEKAKALLAKAGYPNGFKVDFHAPSGRYPQDRELAQAIAGQLAKVGIQANVITPEWSVFWSSARKGKYDMYYFGGFNQVDPDIFLYIYFLGGKDSAIRLGYANPEVDKLILAQRSEYDPEKREEIIRECIKKILDDVPTILLYHHQKLFGVRKNVMWDPIPLEIVMVHDAWVK